MFNDIMLVIAGFLWPPLGYRQRMAKFEREERISYRKWFVDVVIPSRIEQNKRLMGEFNKPYIFAKFIEKEVL